MSNDSPTADAQRSLKSFPWPVPSGASVPPVWTGSGFDLEGQRVAVLRWNLSAGNWSDELTALHEAEAGATHPIDVASRCLALECLTRSCRGAAPVVLEVGCSSGFFAEALSRAVSAAAVICSDYVGGGLEALARRRPDLPCLQFDVTRCPLPDRSVDAVVALNVLEHIQDDARALTEMARIVRPGGVVHVEVPAGPELFDLYDECLMHCRRYNAEQVRALAQKAGLRVARLTHLGFFVYPMFWINKKWSRRLSGLSREAKSVRVAGQIQSSGSSGLMKQLMHLELALGKSVRYPCGIRCVADLIKD